MGLIELAAAKTLASSAVFLFITVLMIAAAKRTATCIMLFAAQCAMITAQIVALAFLHRLRRGIRRRGHGSAGQGHRHSLRTGAHLAPVEGIAAPSAPPPLPAISIFIVAVLILLAFVVVQPYARAFALDSEMLAAATAIVLTGGFLMVSRRKALMQVIGLLVLENGIFLAALTTTFGMPLVIEMGIFFDLLMCVLLMGVFVFRIRETFEHVDVSRLRRLRG